MESNVLTLAGINVAVKGGTTRSQVSREMFGQLSLSPPQIPSGSL
jgi:hypothetical protein